MKSKFWTHENLDDFAKGIFINDRSSLEKLYVFCLNSESSYSHACISTIKKDYCGNYLDGRQFEQSCDIINHLLKNNSYFLIINSKDLCDQLRKSFSSLVSDDQHFPNIEDTSKVFQHCVNFCTNYVQDEGKKPINPYELKVGDIFFSNAGTKLVVLTICRGGKLLGTWPTDGYTGPSKDVALSEDLIIFYSYRDMSNGWYTHKYYAKHTDKDWETKYFIKEEQTIAQNSFKFMPSKTKRSKTC